jgi:hypothetical protein
VGTASQEHIVHHERRLVNRFRARISKNVFTTVIVSVPFGRGHAESLRRGGASGSAAPTGRPSIARGVSPWAMRSVAEEPQRGGSARPRYGRTAHCRPVGTWGPSPAGQGREPLGQRRMSAEEPQRGGSARPRYGRPPTVVPLGLGGHHRLAGQGLTPLAIDGRPVGAAVGYSIDGSPRWGCRWVFH